MCDRIEYLPGGLVSGKVTYSGCFHNLPMVLHFLSRNEYALTSIDSKGLQTHIYAPMGLDLKSKWTLGGTLPQEPRENQELGLGAPKYGLWLREDVMIKCNILMTSFVKKTLQKSHVTLVERLMEKAHVIESIAHNERLMKESSINPLELPGSPTFQGAMPPSPEMQSSGSMSPYLRERQSYLSMNSQKARLASPPYWSIDPSYQIANPYKSEEANSYKSEESNSYPQVWEHPEKRGTTPYQNQKSWGKVAHPPAHDIYPIRSPLEMEG